MIRRRLTVVGRVQNVFYRDWMVDQAATLGIDGWVRNRADGTVEAVIAGPVEVVETMVARCREGPPAARVEYVAVTDEPIDAVLDGFEKRATR